MKKFLFLAIALVAGALAFTSCEKNQEPELIGKVYHYRGVSDVWDGTPYEHDVYIALADNHNLTIKLVNIKPSDDAAPVTLYLCNGRWEGEDGGYHIHYDGTPQLPNGKPFSQWELFDIDGWCDEAACDFDYHINGSTMAIFSGEIVND